MQLSPLQRTIFTLAAVILTAGCGGGGGTSTMPSPKATSTPQNAPNNATRPIAGTEWTYDYGLTTPPSPWSLPTSGTLGIRYDGPTPYRGSTRDETEQAGGIDGTDILNYYSWDGTAFAEYATADMLVPPMPCNTPPRSETVLNVAANFDASQAALNGTAQSYLCGTPNVTLTWSLTVSNAGTAVISVPAGTFSTTKLTGVWTLGTWERDFTSYLYGSDLIERDTTEYRNGTMYAAYSVKLHSGPTNVAIPGPSTLGANYW